MTERQELLEEAEALGLSFAKNAKTANIQKAIDQAKEENAVAVAVEDAGGDEATLNQDNRPTESDIRAQLEEEFAKKLEDEKRKLSANMEVNLAKKSDEASVSKVSFGQAKLKARREALKLIRVNITCKDPSKNSWDGEILSAGNDVIGDVKKFIPFNTEDGYHIPQILINVMKSKKCTVFVNKRVNGQTVKEAKSIGAYGIEYLEPLTEQELNELASDQSARHAID